jgi:hypothetical protein
LERGQNQSSVLPENANVSHRKESQRPRSRLRASLAKPRARNADQRRCYVAACRAQKLNRAAHRRRQIVISLQHGQIAFSDYARR